MNADLLSCCLSGCRSSSLLSFRVAMARTCRPFNFVFFQVVLVVFVIQRIPTAVMAQSQKVGARRIRTYPVPRTPVELGVTCQPFASPIAHRCPEILSTMAIAIGPDRCVHCQLSRTVTSHLSFDNPQLNLLLMHRGPLILQNLRASLRQHSFRWIDGLSLEAILH